MNEYNASFKSTNISVYANSKISSLLFPTYHCGFNPQPSDCLVIHKSLFSAASEILLMMLHPWKYALHLTPPDETLSIFKDRRPIFFNKHSQIPPVRVNLSSLCTQKYLIPTYGMAQSRFWNKFYFCICLISPKKFQVS